MARTFTSLLTHTVFSTSGRVPSLSGVIPPGGGSQSPSTLLYDSAGDVTSDSHTGNQYVYDAEGRICAFQTPNGLGGTIMMGYLYDAEGTRVAKGTITTMSCDPATNGFTMTGNNTGTYVLGPGGEELTQLSGSGAWQRTNVFGGGKQLATYDSMGLHFQIEDALGTRLPGPPTTGLRRWGGRRMQTNADGQPETDIQSLPYGDALVTANDQYAPATADDATPLHFTGKERDTESGNDYFGARYYASTMGRWLSPDWAAKLEGTDPVPYAKLDNPQSLNLYGYEGNNPLARADADGHCWPWCTAIAGAVLGAGAETLHEAIAGKGFSGGKITAAAIGGALVGVIGPAGAAVGMGAAGTTGMAVLGTVVGGITERTLKSAFVPNGLGTTDSPVKLGDVGADVATGLVGQGINKAAGAITQPVVKEVVKDGAALALDVAHRNHDAKQASRPPQSSGSTKQCGSGNQCAQPNH